MDGTISGPFIEMDIKIFVKLGTTIRMLFRVDNVKRISKPKEKKCTRLEIGNDKHCCKIKHLKALNIWLIKLPYEGEKNTRRGGWIVLTFSSFSPTEVTEQKQIEFNFWSDNQNLNAADKTERERERAIIQVPSTNRK